MGIMGRSSTVMAARSQYVTDPIRHVVAAQVGGLLWVNQEWPSMTIETASAARVSHDRSSPTCPLVGVAEDRDSNS